MIQLTQDQHETLFKKILRELQQPFPDGTVEGDGKASKIPSQAYIDRLNTVAGPYCNIIDKGHVYIPESNEVIFTVTVDILGVKRDGTGVQNVLSKSLRDAIAAAKSNAIRDACNSFQMGWRDLASTKEWGSNPGITLLGDNERPARPHSSQNSRSKSTCIIPTCSKVLTPYDHEERAKYGVTQNYCAMCIPDHFKRNAIKNGLTI